MGMSEGCSLLLLGGSTVTTMNSSQMQPGHVLRWDVAEGGGGGSAGSVGVLS
jgi:hypothetical protein